MFFFLISQKTRLHCVCLKQSLIQISRCHFKNSDIWPISSNDITCGIKLGLDIIVHHTRYVYSDQVYISWCILSSINCSGEQDITQHPEEIAPFHTEINEEEINFVKKSWSAAFFHGRRGFTSTVWFNCAYLVLFVRILAPYRTLVII